MEAEAVAARAQAAVRGEAPEARRATAVSRAAHQARGMQPLSRRARAARMRPSLQVEQARGACSQGSQVLPLTCRRRRPPFWCCGRARQHRCAARRPRGGSREAPPNLLAGAAPGGPEGSAVSCCLWPHRPRGRAGRETPGRRGVRPIPRVRLRQCCRLTEGSTLWLRALVACSLAACCAGA